jgi:hypothetical protein
MRPEADENAAHLLDMLHFAREVAERMKAATFDEFLNDRDFPARHRTTDQDHR